MQVCEFKAWFESFTEDMTKLPTERQWSRIKARIDEIDGVPTTERVFRDYYWRRYEPYSTVANWPLGNFPSEVTTVLNANQAFTALGKAEAVSVAA